MSVFYVTLEAGGVKKRIARSATEADAKKHIDDLTNEEGGVARVAAAHGLKHAAAMRVIDLEQVPGDYDKGDGVEFEPEPPPPTSKRSSSVKSRP